MKCGLTAGKGDESSSFAKLPVRVMKCGLTAFKGDESSSFAKLLGRVMNQVVLINCWKG